MSVKQSFGLHAILYNYEHLQYLCCKCPQRNPISKYKLSNLLFNLRCTNIRTSKPSSPLIYFSLCQSRYAQHHLIHMQILARHFKEKEKKETLFDPLRLDVCWVLSSRTGCSFSFEFLIGGLKGSSCARNLTHTNAYSLSCL